MSPTLALSADAALLLFTAGVLLIYLELNRPGLILPGAAGLTLTLLATARFLRLPLSPVPAAACLAAFLLLLISTRVRRHLSLALAATTALLYGFTHLTRGNTAGPPRVLVAVPCALVLGAGTSFLTTIAGRARQNKGLDLK